MALEVMFSQRGKPLLTYEHYKFYQYKLLKSTSEMCWCCIVKTCKAKIYTLGSSEHPVFSRKCGVHEHECVRTEDMNRQKISNSLKRKASDCLAERPLKLIHREMHEQKSTVDTLTTKDMKYIRDSINRAKLKTFPKLPRTTEEVHNFLSLVELKTIKGEDFLTVNDTANNIVVFSCTTNLVFLCQQVTFYVDGTFDYCTKHFLQLFTIHAYCNDVYVPLVYCLLKNKFKTTYAALFKTIMHKCKELGLTWKPENIVVDFERGIHAGIEEMLPEAKIIGCRFHLAQSW